MSKTMKAFSFALFVALAVPSAPVARAQQSKAAPVAPIPPQILDAKTVFISNAGGEIDRNLAFGNYGPPDEPYNEFYAAVKTWGRYQFVDSPSAADLIFQIRFTVAPLPGSVKRGSLTVSEDPQFRLVILDPKTNVILWAFTEHVEPAILQGNRDKNFGLAFHALMTNLMQLVAPQT
ncbi:MAG TPA: hypothetical protein VMH00_02940 [Candidatus Limnocylindrales bacterium]|nr:hypothetical protein [Candidatus Limnocylindrales bacterium]